MTPKAKAAALTLLAATQFVLVLDASIVNVALPSIGRELAVGSEDLSWVVNAYILVFGGFLLLGGRIADLAGRRRTFIAGLGLFAVASLAGALAQSVPWLVAARAVQGLGAALVSPAALALLMTMFTEGSERNRALGVWAALGGSGGAAGAILGGLLTDGLGWQAVLAVNVPLGALGVALAPRLLPESRAALDRRGFDVLGAVTVTAGLALLVYALVDANAAGWDSGQTLALTAAALALTAAFVAIELRSSSPLVPLRIFTDRSLRAANVVTLANTGALFPMFFFLTLYTQDILGYSAVGSGLAQLPLAATIAVSATLAPRVVARTGPRPALVTGLTLLAAGLAWFATLPPDGSFAAHLLGPSLVVGIGEGLVWVASMVAATAGVQPSESGLASGLVNTSQQLGGALGIAALVAVATAHTGTPDSAAALTDGFASGFTGAALLAAAGAALAALILPGRNRPRPTTPPQRAVAVNAGSAVSRAALKLRHAQSSSG